MLAEVVTPENAVVRARELDIAHRALLQQKREVEAEKQRMATKKLQLNKEQSCLR